MENIPISCDNCKYLEYCIIVCNYDQEPCENYKEAFRIKKKRKSDCYKNK